MDLNKKLSMLVSNSLYDSDADLVGISDSESLNSYNDSEDTSNDDFNDEFNLGTLSIDSYLAESGFKEKKKKDKKSKNKKSYELLYSQIDDIEEDEKEKSPAEKLRESSRKMFEYTDLLSADDFDNYLENDGFFSFEEDEEMRNNLISMGRKYARETASSKEASEITKTFADSEKRLKSLYEELDKDKVSLQKDIERMRVPGRGGKSLCDMISAKTSMQNTQLSIVKEINSLRKNIHDLKQKEALRKEAEKAAGNNDISANTLQSIFSSSRSSLINSMGGYSGISGAKNYDDNDYYSNFVSDEMDDEEIQRRYFSDKSSSNDDDSGAKFLEYENRGVEYVLLVNSSDEVQGVIAEDRDGVSIPDYPMPSNINQLSFDIDHVAKTATDNLHRNYRVRRVD